jgi:hypothetical protein
MTLGFPLNSFRGRIGCCRCGPLDRVPISGKLEIACGEPGIHHHRPSLWIADFLTMAGTRYERCSVSDSTLAWQSTTSLVVLLCVICSPSILLSSPASGALPRPSVCDTPCVRERHFVPGGGDTWLTEEQGPSISNRTPMTRS